MQFLKNKHCAPADALCALTGRLILRRHLKTTKAVFAIPNSLKGLEIKEKAGIFQPAVCIGDAYFAVYELIYLYFFMLTL